MPRFLALLLVACVAPTGDSAAPFAPPAYPIDTTPRFTAWDYGYDATEWIYRADLLIQPDEVTLFITQDTMSPWDESWDLLHQEYPERWEIVLPIIDDWLQHGEETLFGNAVSCENPTCESTMAWRLEALRDDARTDCVVWAGAAADVAIVQEEGCRVLAPGVPASE
ncbi:MAG: hypothetical protein ABIO70_02375 [Pseudomonadota bacterium]